MIDEDLALIDKIARAKGKIGEALHKVINARASTFRSQGGWRDKSKGSVRNLIFHGKLPTCTITNTMRFQKGNSILVIQFLSEILLY